MLSPGALTGVGGRAGTVVGCGVWSVKGHFKARHAGACPFKGGASERLNLILRLPGFPSQVAKRDSAAGSGCLAAVASSPLVLPGPGDTLAPVMLSRVWKQLTTKCYLCESSCSTRGSASAL